jgi:hypothetical protein
VPVPPWPKTWISPVLAMAGVPPLTATVPLTKILPAGSAADHEGVVGTVAETRQYAGGVERSGGRVARRVGHAAIRPAVSAVASSSRRLGEISEITAP